MALAEHLGSNGRDVIDAFVVGVEVQCRVARAVLPSHYDTGWHITATAGVFGAAAASARLLKLTEQQTVWSLGLAATQAAGLREMFGSMAKSLHPGRAAQNGLAAALLARANFTSAEAGVEGKRGFANVLSTTVDLARCTEALGERYDLLRNMYKPYACGLVVHPSIDGCIRLRDEHGVKPEEVERIDLEVDPIVLEVTAKPAPVSGLESKFSVYHAAAVALIDGAADEEQFGDASTTRADVIRLRGKVHATPTQCMPRDAARVTVRLRGGKTVSVKVDHCSGSVAQPMTDAQLDRKFMRQCEPVLGAARAESARDVMRRLDRIENISSMLAQLAL